jgi:hypothetical protein
MMEMGTSKIEKLEALCDPSFLCASVLFKASPAGVIRFSGENQGDGTCQPVIFHVTGGGCSGSLAAPDHQSTLWATSPHSKTR